jgi:hypothetical protein
MKITLDVAVTNAKGKTCTLELDTDSGEIAVKTPVMIREPRIRLGALSHAPGAGLGVATVSTRPVSGPGSSRGGRRDGSGSARRERHTRARAGRRTARVARGTDQVALGLAAARLFQPWNGERSPASHASRSPGVLGSQSGRISALTARRSCQRSTTEGRPQNQ